MQLANGTASGIDVVLLAEVVTTMSHPKKLSMASEYTTFSAVATAIDAMARMERKGMDTGKTVTV